VIDEKGTFTEEHVAFDANSTFGVIQSAVADGDEVLVCDDLGDEWADFIGLNNTSSPPRITFYHAKHGELSLGAGAFHISVSQAIKNLQRMSLPAEAMSKKISRWKKQYINGGVTTSIPRIVRGYPEQLASEFERARSAPDAIRRVFIVTSSLSRGAVEGVLAGISAGRAPDPYFVQLYWLLLSFFSACTEMNALGYVVCQE
jgi:phage shock protein PspC (stress-responsive transcriptional regulator)